MIAASLFTKYSYLAEGVRFCRKDREQVHFGKEEVLPRLLVKDLLC